MAADPHKELAGIILGVKKPEDDDQDGEPKDDEALRSAAEDLITAVHAKDADGVMEALKDAYEICDSMPHDEDEGEKPEEDEQ